MQRYNYAVYPALYTRLRINRAFLCTFFRSRMHDQISSVRASRLYIYRYQIVHRNRSVSRISEQETKRLGTIGNR